MSNSEQSIVLLQKILERGSWPVSRCGVAFRAYIQPLLDTQVITVRRAAGGRQLFVRNSEALSNFIQSEFPNAIIEQDMPSRIKGVARLRNSKTLANDTPEIVCVRSWNEEALRKDGQPCMAASATAAHGAFSFMLGSGSTYTLHGTHALVENPAAFASFERFGVNTDVVVYGQGRCSNRLLSWLDTMTDEFQLLHLPDYDPVGLSEFERLRRQLGNRVELYVPENIDVLFERYSNRELLMKGNSQSMLSTLRTTSSMSVRVIVELIDKHNAGLEQEALLV
ncbi:MAG: DUF2220 family protein [Flavobacteriales bacterium]